MTREYSRVIAGLAILALSACPGLAADLRFAGYLVDRSCGDNLKAQGATQESLQVHSKECALNENCSRDGYSLYSKGKWYQLDKKGNELARQVLKASKTKEGHFVSISGTLDKEQLKVTTLKELAQDQ